MSKKIASHDLIIELKGSPEDFGFHNGLDGGEILTTQTLVSRFNIIPGSRAAREYWDAVQAHAMEEGKYGCLSIDFGKGGLSALVYDRMVVYYGMSKTTANLMTKIYFLTKGGIRW